MIERNVAASFALLVGMLVGAPVRAEAANWTQYIGDAPNLALKGINTGAGGVTYDLTFLNIGGTVGGGTWENFDYKASSINVLQVTVVSGDNITGKACWKHAATANCGDVSTWNTAGTFSNQSIAYKSGPNPWSTDTSPEWAYVEFHIVANTSSPSYVAAVSVQGS